RAVSPRHFPPQYVTQLLRYNRRLVRTRQERNKNVSPQRDRTEDLAIGDDPALWQAPPTPSSARRSAPSSRSPASTTAARASFARISSAATRVARKSCWPGSSPARAPASCRNGAA